MTLDELLAQLKTDHAIDVPELQQQAAAGQASVALSNKIQEALIGSDLLKLSNGEEVTSDVLISAVAEAGTKIVELSNKVDTLVTDGLQKAAETRVDGLVRTGHITPAKRDTQVKLLLSNAEMFEDLLPEKPIVKLSQENGDSTPDEITEKNTVESEIARLSAIPAAAAYIRS